MHKINYSAERYIVKLIDSGSVGVFFNPLMIVEALSDKYNITISYMQAESVLNTFRYIGLLKYRSSGFYQKIDSKTNFKINKNQSDSIYVELISKDDAEKLLKQFTNKNLKIK